MTRLESVLEQFRTQGDLGPVRFDRKHLKSALAVAGRQSTIIFWTAAALQVGVFVIDSWFVIRYASNPKVISYALGAGGGGLAALGFAMVRLWKDKVATDLTIALVTSLDESAARSVLETVLQSLRKTGDPVSSTSLK